MRCTGADGKLRVQAIAGTRCVLFGMDVGQDALRGLLGFSVTRSVAGGAAQPLDNFLLFEANDTGHDADHSTLANPLQTFLWGDYEAAPGTSVTYAVSAMYGSPSSPEARFTVPLELTMEDPATLRNGVWFNRGVVGSQAYTDRFGNPPDPLADPDIRDWLSRGLRDALLAFIGEAAGAADSLRCAFYELSNLDVLKALADARGRGVDVAIVYSADDDPGPVEHAGLSDVASRRAHAVIAHNKFVVLSPAGKPSAVWTGSTNITDSGMYGQANVGHLIRDESIARDYLAYWGELQPDPLHADLVSWNAGRNPPVAMPDPNQTARVFSPQSPPGELGWYTERIASAASSAFITAPFGLNKDLIDALGLPGGAFRYAIVDTADANVAALEPKPDVWATTGAAFTHAVPGLPWLPEAPNSISNYVRYIHSKFLLIDPLSDDPLVVTGSANFSAASTFQNDENMLVIRGDTAAADVYLTEFMRLFTHFRFRYWSQHQPTVAAGLVAPAPGTRYLDETDSWTDKFFDPTDRWCRERLVFRAAP